MCRLANELFFERLFDAIWISREASKATKRSNLKIHVPNSQESCIATVPNSQQPQPPSHLLNEKWISHEQQPHMCVQCSYWCKTSIHLQGLTLCIWKADSCCTGISFGTKLLSLEKMVKTVFIPMPIRCNMYFSGSIKNCKQIRSEKPWTEFPGKLHSYSSE